MLELSFMAMQIKLVVVVAFIAGARHQLHEDKKGRSHKTAALEED